MFLFLLGIRYVNLSIVYINFTPYPVQVQLMEPKKNLINFLDLKMCVYLSISCISDIFFIHNFHLEKKTDIVRKYKNYTTENTIPYEYYVMVRKIHT